MSDYGFATFDKKTGRKDVSVNSKWPIFGPRYKDIKNAFKTIHITDTKQYNPNAMSASSVVLPPTYPVVEGEAQYLINQYHASVREDEPILTIPHGFDKRPLGYVTISGTYSKNTRCVWDYTNFKDDWGDYPPSAKLEGAETIAGAMLSVAGSEIQDLNEPAGAGGAFYNNPWAGSGTGIISYPDGTADWLRYNEFSIPGDNSSIPDEYPPGKYRPPYSVEVDDKNIYVYRHYYWCDVYKRYYYIGNTISMRGYDLRARIKGVIDYAGSDFDLTIYLCPYSMEDLI